MDFLTWFQLANPSTPTITVHSIQKVLELALNGATVPFMARYRKEQTGGLDEVAIQAILDGQEKWDLIIKRQAFILGEIDHQKKLTPELKEKISSTFQLELLEDLYLPYKVKRKTKAAVAREAGLDLLADWIWNCGHGTETPQPGQTLELWAFTFRNEAKGIPDTEAAIAGAQDILIERLAEIQELRQLVRDQLFAHAVVHTEKSKKAKPNSKFENYFCYREAISSLRLPQNSHRYLAMKRGWMEEELLLTLEGAPDDNEFEAQLIQAFKAAACTVPDSPGATVLWKAAQLAYKAHVFTSIENEVHKVLKEVADDAAIKVFAENVRKLLLASPFGAHSVLGVDPGIRTGCKIAVLDEAGKYIASTVIYLQSEAEREKSQTLLIEVLKTGNITAIAIGNGTAGRETEAFVRSAVQASGLATAVVMVNESGASIYSASEIARDEFPDLDITIRGAISIARRLQDPLAELVKIDPKSIGVGQYQHDVSPHALKRSLTHVVESCVNQVGVNLNTASYHLLAHVSGIGPVLAKSIVDHRLQKGLFQSKNDLFSIHRFSQKVFEQAVGFLRIPNGQNPLDNTGIHPENYAWLETVATQLGKTIQDFLGAGAVLLKTNPVFQEQVGSFTLNDIIHELEKPGRDPRDKFLHFQFREDIHEVKDLKPGMLCPGIVTNVTNFGAFVDIGVHQDGLVHISQFSEHFVKDPRERISPGDHVKVRVLEFSLEKNQISLSLRNTVEKHLLPQIKQNSSQLSRKVSPSKEPRKAIEPLSPEKRGRTPESLSQIPIVMPQSGHRPSLSKKGIGPRKPKEAFNNPFGGLVSLRQSLKQKT